MRALDYLLTRPEVDKQQIGVTGNSGGGTMTTWLCGVEQRWAMGAPSCFVTTFRRNMENELPPFSLAKRSKRINRSHKGWLGWAMCV